MKRLARTVGLALSLIILLAVANPAAAQNQSNGRNAGIFATTVAYVDEFYPLWFTYNQGKIGNENILKGPDTISPVYHIVVAINNDTLYSNTFVNISKEPLIVTLPSTQLSYSILTLDRYGNIFDTGIPAGKQGTYALVGPNWTGTLPNGVTPEHSPLDDFILVFRIDRFSGENDLTTQAEELRKNILAQPLSAYESDPTGGGTLIFPVIDFAEPFKTTADNLIAKKPILFLKQLQTAVHSSPIPPLSGSAQALSNTFDKLFQGGNVGGAELSSFSNGAQAAHALLVDHYLSHTGPTNWINFTNIGQWGNNFLDRASITEFIQYGNGPKTAEYFHAFVDSKGRALNGIHPRGYVLTFAADQIPQAKRFWSVTAYTPHSVELIPNAYDKYLVASYTPGLETNPDGSISIYISKIPPNGVPLANWLPVGNRRFNIMLRLYGPELAPGTYVPPAIVRVKGKLRR